MPHRLSGSASAALALWVCVAASVICIRTAEAAWCGCSSQAEIFIPRSTSNDSIGNNSSEPDTSPPPVSEARKDIIRIDDMLIPIADLEMAMSADGSSGGIRYSASASSYINCIRPWPNGGLYYRFDTTYPSSYKTLIRLSLARLQIRTSNLITFVESDYYTSVAHVTIINGDGCSSYIGKMYSYSSQSLSLSVPGCMLESIIQHEFMHALGFYHEQSRMDRDSYVRILWGNIDSDTCNNFAKQTHLIPSNFPSYDYGSVMHYTSSAFACTNGLNTIVKMNGGTVSVRNNLSDYDVAKLKYIYSASNLDYCFGSTGSQSKLSGSSVTGSWAHVVACLLTICYIGLCH